jgi:hypothetical protein
MPTAASTAPVASITCRRRPAQRGRAGEPGDAEHYHAARPEHVGEPAAEGEARGECQQVGVDDPLGA